MSNSAKPPRKHHYVSRFYLEGFCAPASAKTNGKRLLWVYEQRREPRCSVPGAEGWQRDFYSSEENGTKKIDTERWFAGLETRIAPLIADIVTCKRGPTDAEKTCLAAFMGTMYTRTPLGRQLSDERFGPATSQMLKRVATDPDEFRKLYFTMDARFRPQDDDETIEQVRLDILSGKNDALEERGDFRLDSIIEVGITVGEVLFEMGWQFVYAPDGHTFITSDNPVVSEVSEPGSPAIHFRSGVNLPNAVVWFPLTRDVCLVMQKGLTPGIATTNASTARAMNKRIMICAERRIYAGEYSLGLQKAFVKHGCKVPVESLDLRYEGRAI